MDTVYKRDTVINRLERIQLVGRDTQDLTENYSKTMNYIRTLFPTPKKLSYTELYVAHKPPLKTIEKQHPLG